MSDIGGFVDIVYLIPVSFMAAYSERMYQAQIYSEVPIKKKKKETKQNQRSPILEKLAQGKYKFGQNLNHDDLQYLNDETERLYQKKPQFWKYFCAIQKCRKQSLNKWRRRENALEKFEKQLDIRSFMGVHTNVSLLITLLFNEEQRVLFWHQNERIINEEKDETLESQSTMKFSTYITHHKKSKFHMLKNFCIASELDRNLFLGVFEDQAVIERQKAMIKPFKNF